MQVHIRQAKVIDPASQFHNKHVDITIKDGVIEKITASGSGKKGSSIDVDGKSAYGGKGTSELCISRGWVDIMADYREPGYEHKETIETGMGAAAAGGFTNVCLLPNTNPAISNKSAVEFILKKATGNVVSVHPFGSISKNIEGVSLSEMMDMHTTGAIAFTDGWEPVQNANLMLKALEYVKAFDGVLIQIPQDKDISGSGLMHEGEMSTKLGMQGIPVETETIIINRDLELLRYTNSRLHFTGVSSAAGVDLIRKAKKEKLNVTCSVTPYHLALTDKSLSDYDSMYKVSPPLRSEKDRQALIKGLKDGTIDCIASHHRPHEWDAKNKEFDYASYGMNIQEVAFNIALQGTAGKVDEETLINALSTKPAVILGLTQPEIKKGEQANLTIFTFDNKRKLDKLQSLGINNPFLGKELSGDVIGIVNNGLIKFQ